MASPNAAVKAAAVVAGMLAGADCIDDLDVLRHGAMGRVFTGVRAPSTLGTFLRSFTFGHVRQLDAVDARPLAGLATSVPRLLAGAGTLNHLPERPAGSRSSTSMTPSGRSTATRSRAPRTGTPRSTGSTLSWRLLSPTSARR